MEKLNFEWHDSRNGGEYRAEANGFIVRAVHDDSPENPWDAWDGQPPLIVYSDRSLDEKGDVPNPLADMTDSFIARNWRALCKIFDQSPDAAQERKSDYAYVRIADAKRDLLDEWLDEIKPSRYSGHAGDYMVALGELCELRGWPSLSTSSHGYCQSDYAELLLIFSPAYAKEIGAAWPRRRKRKLARAWKPMRSYGAHGHGGTSMALSLSRPMARNCLAVAWTHALAFMATIWPSPDWRKRRPSPFPISAKSGASGALPR